MLSCSVLSDSLRPHVPLSMGFFRQECWSRLPFPSPGDLPDPGIEPVPPVTPAVQTDSLQGGILSVLYASQPPCAVGSIIFLLKIRKLNLYILTKKGKYVR